MNNTDPIGSNAPLINKKRDHFLWLSFLIWPFGTLVYSIFNTKKYESRNVVWLFACFYGLSIVASYTGLDAYRYSEDFIFMANNQFSFKEVFGNYFIAKGETDVYEPFLMFIVSRFTSNPQIFYAIVGLFFGYFYSRNIWLIIDNTFSSSKRNQGFYLGLLLLTFSFIQSLHSLQFVRFSTATVVFVYGFLHVYINKKNHGYIWMLITPLIHFSFIFPLAIAVLFKFIPKKVNWFFGFFIFSTFIFETKLDFLSDILGNIIPSFLQGKVESYTNPLYAEAVNESISVSNWYIKYRTEMLTYIGYLYIIYIFVQGKQTLKKEPAFLNIFCFFLLFSSIANIFAIVPSMNRFVNIALYVLYAFIILFTAHGPRTKYLHFINLLSVPILIIYIIVGLRISLETSSWILFFGNPVLSLFITNQAPFIEAIKSLL